MRLLALTMLSMAIACATPQQPTLAFSLTEDTYGIYEVKGGENQFIDATEDIPCELGLSFGVKMTLTPGSKSGGLIPIGGEMRTPPVEGLRPAVKELVPDEVPVPEGTVSVSFTIGYAFDEPAEMVPGSYLIRLYNRSTDETLHVRDFRVAGCP